MYSFTNDYSEGAHPRILEKLIQTNLEQIDGYGEDAYCAQAASLIKEAARCPHGAVHFIPGGTQANLLAISSMLRPHQAVIAAATGHINVHETGAIEATGHKVLTAEYFAATQDAASPTTEASCLFAAAEHFAATPDATAPDTEASCLFAAAEHFTDVPYATAKVPAASAPGPIAAAPATTLRRLSPTPSGRLTPDMVRQVLDAHTDEHMVQPKMVYISDTTETGLIYRKSELDALGRLCRQKGLYLFLDGARLGAALTCAANDLELSDIASACDLFTIGGTKNGALFGEALVITNPALREDFRFLLKQRGAMLAKGWLLGVQFAELFSPCDLVLSTPPAPTVPGTFSVSRAGTRHAGMPLSGSSASAMETRSTGAPSPAHSTGTPSSNLQAAGPDTAAPLYFALARHANETAAELARHLAAAGFPFLYPPCTNQLFPILPDALIARLEAEFRFMRYKKINGAESAVRLVTSWATKPESVAAFGDALRRA
ncbi:MAG: hypothetical protein LBR77_06990 [Lachnospiraceae bacterium]|jgi:threonine aldolase|nr:hypothetical protein [Lachnospiraceae bacterium]